MTNHNYLHGIALKNYRGIGDEIQYVGKFSQFNFFIGPNNSGKSTILYFLLNHLESQVLNSKPSKRHESTNIGEFDCNILAPQRGMLMAFGVPIDIILERVITSNASSSTILRQTESIKKILQKISIDGLLWVKKGSADRQVAFELIEPSFEIKELQDLLKPQEWHDVWTAVTTYRGGGSLEKWVKLSVEQIANTTPNQIPNTNFIPAIRQISKKGDAFDDLSGKGLIEELARLQNPGPTERDKLKLFESINNFLKSVTANNTASIEITHDREHVLVKIDDKTLPLQNLGTGIHEVIMIAAFCTMHKNQIICIEEPEIHLHPILQKRLISYLSEKTSNQYFIATHSASLIDFPSASVFNVCNKSGSTKITPLQTTTSKFDAIRDLGYKASDILQSNSIVWVEGPSDRIYINHWLNAVDPNLREGIHYSIMFYGGRLLSHLKADEYSEDEASALIELCKINRNFSIVLDSDRKTSSDPLNATKNRIIDELGQHGVAWVTKGREIENYVHKDAMTSAISSVYPTSFSKRHKTGQYDHVLPFKKLDETISNTIDKVAVAKHIATLPPDLSTLDLEFQINRIAKMIHEAN